MGSGDGERRDNWFRMFLAGVTVEEVQRFDATRPVVQTELDRRSEDRSGPWSDAVATELANATGFRDRYKLEAAWTALKAADREMVRSYGPSELAAEARIVRSEAADKLSGWRAAAIGELLTDEALSAVEPGGGAKAAPPNHIEAGPFVDDLRTRLIKARWIVDTYSDTTYHKFRILRRAVIITSGLLAAVLAALVAIVALEWIPIAPDDSPLQSWRLLLAVMSLGAIGALLSSATRLSSRDDKLRVPDLRVSYTLMGMRPFVGAAGAIVVIVMLQSGLAGVTVDSEAIYAIAIAAGFTERLVTNTVTSAANAVGS